jgi:hypothetical protein
MFTPRFLTNCKFNVKLTTVIVLLVLLQTNSFALNGKIKKKLKEMSTIDFSLKKTELGLNVGLMGYIGDLKANLNPYNQSNLAVGFQVRNELNNYIAIRVCGSYGHIEADDAKAVISDLKKRNLSFRSPITDFGVIGEFSLPIRFDHRSTDTGAYRYSKLVPYVYVGVQGFKFNPMAYYQGQWYDLQPLHTEGKANSYNLMQISIPFGFGFKYRITNKISVAAEFGISKTFTDYLDDVSTTYQTYEVQKAENGQLSADISYRSDELPGRETSVIKKEGILRGSPKYNDFYLSNMFSFRYKLGK